MSAIRLSKYSKHDTNFTKKSILWHTFEFYSILLNSIAYRFLSPYKQRAVEGRKYAIVYARFLRLFFCFYLKMGTIGFIITKINELRVRF